MLRTLHHPEGRRDVHLGGWKRQHADPRDEAFRLKLHPGFARAPASVDNRSFCGPVEDQGPIGSCTAQMFASLVEANQIRLGKVAARKKAQVSRLFHYYATRKLEGTCAEDSGATIRDAIRAGVKYGVVEEKLYPYVPSIFLRNPPKPVWQAAQKTRVTSYHPISDGDLGTMKSVLASGYLVGLGIEVYDYMLSTAMAESGVLKMPRPKERLQGGHAICLVGYDDAAQLFLARNSWGPGWGDGGYFRLPYAYVASPKLSSDFWVVESLPL